MCFTKKSLLWGITYQSALALQSVCIIWHPKVPLWRPLLYYPLLPFTLLRPRAPGRRDVRCFKADATGEMMARDLPNRWAASRVFSWFATCSIAVHSQDLREESPRPFQQRPLNRFFDPETRNADLNQFAFLFCHTESFADSNKLPVCKLPSKREFSPMRAQLPLDNFRAEKGLSCNALGL